MSVNPGRSVCNKCGGGESYKGEAGLLFCKGCDEWLAPECFPDRAIPEAKTCVEELEDAIEAFVSRVREEGGYMPAIATLLRLKADEFAERFPDEVNQTWGAS